MTNRKESLFAQRPGLANAAAKATGPALVGGMTVRIVWRRLLLTLAVLGTIGGATTAGVHFARERAARTSRATPTPEEERPAEASRAAARRPIPEPRSAEEIARDIGARTVDASAKRDIAMRAYSDMSRMAATWRRLGDHGTAPRPQPPAPSSTNRGAP